MGTMTPKFEASLPAVDAWVAREAEGLSAAQCLHLFELAFEHLWKTSSLTISILTLQAVLSRALFHGSETYPFLSEIGLDDAGLHWQELRKAKAYSNRDELLAGLACLLAGFIVILGNITNQVITAQLCEELNAVKYVPKMKVVKGKNGEVE